MTYLMMPQMLTARVFQIAFHSYGVLFGKSSMIIIPTRTGLTSIALNHIPTSKL